MSLVWITALGIGGATVAGALLGFAFKRIPHRFNDVILSFAAGVMLCAAMVGLILPALEHAGKGGAPLAALGVIAGAGAINLLDRFVPHLHNVAGIDREKHGQNTQQLNKVLLFVTAIAIHNLPEGIAAGVSFGTGDVSDAISVASGIALFYKSEDLEGKKIALVCNLKPATLCGVESNGMILASGEDPVTVLFLNETTPLGSRIR